ncbi:MAG TPA: TetR family transcriptional regulator C-terminal domain-containing protein [Kofleriaceae bacterium]|nr:TetR family transcriptional regulator C-terminal domain-containing protein [Kofleriaceae bacterium]
MDKPNAKEKLLAEGLKLVHRNGFATTSVRDVTSAAGVALGAFTQSFESKEVFGLEVIALYTQYSEKLVADTLDNEDLGPLARLRAYIAGHIAMMKRDGNRSGCLYGNFCAETPSAGEDIRKVISVRLAEREESVANCLSDAVDAGELPKTFDVESTATFVIAALQGALLISKVRHSGGPMEALKSVLFDRLLVK